MNMANALVDVFEFFAFWWWLMVRLVLVLTAPIWLPLWGIGELVDRFYAWSVGART